MGLLSSIPLPLVGLVVLFAVAVGAGLYAVVLERQRRAVLRRAIGGGESGGGTALLKAATDPALTRSVLERIGDWVGARAPVQFGDNTAVGSKLVQAGFDSSSATTLFNLLRLVSAVAVPMLGLLVAPRDDVMLFALAMGIAVIIGLLGPQAVLDGMMQRRQDTIRKGVPDTLDLLVVCVEAGVALDSAIQRVAREMRMVHPILADELMGMSRRISAGMAREQALQLLYLRTGLDELRGLASHMLQSEKWGTSIANVLRVYADQLRRKRKMLAEKRAATASTRMLIPLALFIFPTIFVVLLGPAGLEVSKMFDAMGK